LYTSHLFLFCVVCFTCKTSFLISFSKSTQLLSFYLTGSVCFALSNLGLVLFITTKSGPGF
jgi:hypothetical protein